MTLFREWEAQKYLRVGLLNTAAALLIIYVLAKYREAATSKSFIFNSQKRKEGQKRKMQHVHRWISCGAAARFIHDAASQCVRLRSLP